MLNSLLVVLSLFVSSAWAQPMVPSCPVEGKSWDVLVQEFVSSWQPENAGFCEFKRFIALNAMISDDMRMNEEQYEARIAGLESFNDQSEPVNYLLASFQETWFNLFFDSIMEREYSRGKIRWTLTGGITGAAAMLALAVPVAQLYSTKSIGILRGALASYIEKRAIAFGFTSGANGTSKLTFGTRPELKTEFVRPPLMRKLGSPIDTRTKDIFVNRFWSQLQSTSAGIAGGWVTGHYASLGVKKVAPKWSKFFNRSWAQGKIANFASPGMIVGTAVTFYVTDRVTTYLAKKEFYDSVEITKNSLLDVVKNVNAAVTAEDEYLIWMRGEQLKNGLMLQNYMLTRGMIQGISDETERAVGRVIKKFSNCWQSHSSILEEERAVFQNRMKSLIASEERNLQVALDITDTVQNALLVRTHPMSDPLIKTGANFLSRDRWLMDPNELTKDFWFDVEQAVKNEQPACGLMDSSGSYP